MKQYNISVDRAVLVREAETEFRILSGILSGDNVAAPLRAELASRLNQTRQLIEKLSAKAEAFIPIRVALP